MKRKIIFPAALLIGLALCLNPGGAALGQAEDGTRILAEEGASDDLLSEFDESESNEGEEDEEDLESGFDDEEQDLGAETVSREEEQSIWTLGGFIRWDSSYNFAHKEPSPGQTDFRGLSKFRVALRLEVGVTPSETWEVFASGQVFHDFAYDMNGRDQYEDTVLDRHEEEGELREAFLRVTPTGSLDITMGRQIVAWGKSDNIQVVDIINPLDFREPGLIDIADLKLPVTMTRVDYFLGDWGMTAIAIHEVRFSKNPALGSDFNPVAGPAVLPIPDPPYTFPNPQYVEEEVPEDGGENTQYAASLNGIFSGWDLGFYWAQVFSEETHLKLINPLTYEFRLVHSEITMGGMAINVALGNWLLKSEVAQFTGYEFFITADRKFTRNDGLLGIEYSGLRDTTLSFEAINRHWAGFDMALENFPDNLSENANQYVLTYRGSFLRETLDLVAIFSYYGAKAEQGGLQRYSATYELAEALDLTGGVVLYEAGDESNYGLTTAQDNDRAFLDLKWSF